MSLVDALLKQLTALYELFNNDYYHHADKKIKLFAAQLEVVDALPVQERAEVYRSSFVASGKSVLVQFAGFSKTLMEIVLISINKFLTDLNNESVEVQAQFFNDKKILRMFSPYHLFFKELVNCGGDMVADMFARADNFPVLLQVFEALFERLKSNDAEAYESAHVIFAMKKTLVRKKINVPWFDDACDKFKFYLTAYDVTLVIPELKRLIEERAWDNCLRIITTKSHSYYGKRIMLVYKLLASDSEADKELLIKCFEGILNGGEKVPLQLKQNVISLLKEEHPYLGCNILQMLARFNPEYGVGFIDMLTLAISSEICNQIVDLLLSKTKKSGAQYFDFLFYGIETKKNDDIRCAVNALVNLARELIVHGANSRQLADFFRPKLKAVLDYLQPHNKELLRELVEKNVTVSCFFTKGTLFLQEAQEMKPMALSRPSAVSMEAYETPNDALDYTSINVNAI